jgi:hypothetical protein
MPSAIAPPQLAALPDTARLVSRAPRPTIIDRAAHRLAVALLIWSTRRPKTDHDTHTRVRTFADQQAVREREYFSGDPLHAINR